MFVVEETLIYLTQKNNNCANIIKQTKLNI